MKYFTAIALCCTLLSGCASSILGPSRVEQIAMNRTACDGYGFTPRNGRLRHMHDATGPSARRAARPSRPGTWTIVGPTRQGFEPAAATRGALFDLGRRQLLHNYMLLRRDA